MEEQNTAQQPTQSIRPGLYDVQTILTHCGLVVDDSYDRRRIKLGGLGFDSLDEQLRIPDTAETFVVTVDGQPHTTFTVVQQ